MSKFRGVNRHQLFLLPPSVEDFVPEGHMARLVDEVVEGLCTHEIEEKYSHLGRKAYEPKMLIKILFYGYSTGDRSSRKLARKCEMDLAYLYLSGMERPDFRTISDFRKNNLEKLKGYFRDIVLFCREAGLGRGRAVFIDGTKIRANAAAKRTKKKEKLDELIRETDAEIERIFREAKDVDEAEDREYGERRGDELPPELQKASDRRRRLDEAKKRLEAEGLKKVNVTDPDAKMMQERRGVIRPGYNGQCAVTGDGVIVAQDLVCEANDKNQLKPMVEQSQEILQGAVEQVIADAGYGTYENLEYLKKAGFDGYVHDFAGEIRKILRGKEGENRYHRFNFTYDKKKDRFLCPEGKELLFYKGRDFRRQHILVYKGYDCGTCSVREQCTKGEYRTISQDERTGLILEMLEKLRSEVGEEIYKRRMCTVEPVYGNLKENLGFRRFLLRGHEKASGEFALMCIGHNLGKLFRAVKGQVERTGCAFKSLLKEAGGILNRNLFGLSDHIGHFLPSLVRVVQ